MRTYLALAVLLLASIALPSTAHASDGVTRVFIFAGQSNMVGSDSKVRDIKRFPPFAGLEEPQKNVLFSYTLGRENKTQSNGWVGLEAVNNVVGPELSFARKVAGRIDAPIAIIKCAAGGTHLGGDWNPEEPSGFKMYPLMLELVRSSLAELDKKSIKYRIEGFMWHQGENDMFNEDYKRDYGVNLREFVAKVRHDLKIPQLHFYIGELCTKTIWGMDLRPRMYAISLGQKFVADADPLADYVRTSHVGVEIGGGVGLHYHYGTLGQLEHGVNYADAYLKTVDKQDEPSAALAKWPYPKGGPIKLFVLAGHRNMEGERAFVQEMQVLEEQRSKSEKRGLLQDNAKIPYKYSIGGDYKISNSWEPLGPRGYYDTFGPELSFGETLAREGSGQIAIAKYTHSGSQIIDWTPAGSDSKSRNLYARFVAFVRSSIDELTAKGHTVELAGIFYHVGENDMSFGSYRKQAAARIHSFITQSRKDLGLPGLRWFVSQQPPTDDERVNGMDVTADLEKIAAQDDSFIHIKAFELPEQEKKLVLDTAAIEQLGDLLAREYLKRE